MTFKPKYNTLVEIFEDSTKKHRGRPLFGTKSGSTWKWMSYDTFEEKVNQCRGGLVSLGVGKGDVVAVISNNRPEWAIGAYATYTLSAQYAPMYEAQMDKEWKYILADCSAKVVFAANSEIAERLLSFEKDLPALDHIVVLDGAVEGAMTFDEVLERGAGAPSPITHPEPEDIAGFIYTSGTTGNPKGVLLSQQNLANNISAIFSVFPMSPEDRSLSFLPWAHSFGQTCELHGLFAMGASMGIAESIPKIVENLGEVKPTLLFAVPRIFNKIYAGLNQKMDKAGGLKKKLFDGGMANASKRKELAAERKSSMGLDMKHKFYDKVVFSKVREAFGGRLRYAFSGGAAIATEVADFIDNLGIEVYEGYGLTETSPIATANWPGSRKIGSVGQPVPGVRVEIDGSVLEDPKGEGEIIIFGHNVMQGYHGLPEENEKVLVKGGGFRTGDRGKMDSDGYVYITGRIKEQYKLENGKYVVPTPLEDQIKLSPYVSNAMVYGMNKKFNVAVVVPDMTQVGPWAKDQGLTLSDIQEAAKHTKVIALMQEAVDAANNTFKGYERVRHIAIGDVDFTTDNGMLTPKMSVKRRKVFEHYEDTILGLYTE